MSDFAVPGFWLPPKKEVARPQLLRPLRRWRTAKPFADSLTQAVTLDQNLGTDSTSGGAVTIVTTNAVASGAYVVVGYGSFNSGAAAAHTVSGGGLTWTKLHELPSGSLRSSIWGAPAPSGLAASTTITCTCGGGAADNIGGAGSFLGVDTASPLRAFNAAAATSTAWATGTITSSSGDALFSVCFEDGSGTASSTPTSPAVELYDLAVAGQTEAEVFSYKLSVAGSDSLAGTWSVSVSHVAVGVALKPAAAGGGATFRQRKTLFGVGR